MKDRRRPLGPWIAVPALLAAVNPARAADVTAIVRGVRNESGMVVLGICPKATFLTEHCPYSARVPARTGSVTFHVSGVAAGIYALLAYHDENANGRLDRNFLGIPTEAVALSRDPEPRLGPPAFADSALSISIGAAAVTMTLRYN